MITLLSSGIVTPHIETVTAYVADALDTDRINSGGDILFSSSKGTPETVTINGVTGEINAKEIISENIETETVNDKLLPVYLSSNLEFTVGTGGDYATLNLALDDVYKKYKPCREYSKVILRIIDSTLPSFNYTIKNIDMGFIEIKYKDNVIASCVRDGNYLLFTTSTEHDVTIGTPVVIMPTMHTCINYAQFGTIYDIPTTTSFRVSFTAHDYGFPVNCIVSRPINTPHTFLFTANNSKAPVFNLGFYSDDLNKVFRIISYNSNMVFEEHFSLYNVSSIGIGSIYAGYGSNIVMNKISLYSHPSIMYINNGATVLMYEPKIYSYVTSDQYGIIVNKSRFTVDGVGYLYKSGTGTMLSVTNGGIVALPDADAFFTLTDCSIPYNTLHRDGIVFYDE